MTKFYLYFLLTLPFSVQAFDFGKLSELSGDPEKMQQEAEKMAKSMAEAAACMDAETMKKIQAEGAAMQERIKALCDKGDRNGAEKAVVAYSKKMMASPEFQKITECSAQLMSYLPPGYLEETKTGAAKTAAASEEPRHICDMQ